MYNIIITIYKQSVHSRRNQGVPLTWFQSRRILSSLAWKLCTDRDRNCKTKLAAAIWRIFFFREKNQFVSIRVWTRKIRIEEEKKRKEKKRLYTHWKGSFRRGKEVLNHIVFLLLEAWTKKSLVAINLEIDLLRWDIWSEPSLPIKNCLVCHLRPVTPYDRRHSVCFYKKID